MLTTTSRGLTATTVPSITSRLTTVFRVFSYKSSKRWRSDAEYASCFLPTKLQSKSAATVAFCVSVILLYLYLLYQVTTEGFIIVIFNCPPYLKIGATNIPQTDGLLKLFFLNV